MKISKQLLLQKSIYCFVFASLWMLDLSAQNLYPVEKKVKWGYMDANGNMQIDFQFDLAGTFNEGFASVALNRMPCLIDANENRVIDTGLYQYIGPVSEGLVSVMDYRFKRYFLDTKGKTVLSLDPEIYDAGNFHAGWAKVGRKKTIHQNKFGFDVSNLGYEFTYINKQGKYMTGFDYDDVEDFNATYARIIQNNKYGIINTKAEILLNPQYDQLGAYNEGLACFEQGGKFGLIDSNGKIIVDAKFELLKAVNEGMAAFAEKNKWGFVNAEGAVVIPATYNNVNPFSEGLAAVQINDKWGFINKDGKVIFQALFNATGMFNEGICPVKMKGKWGAIDHTGKVLVPFEMEYIGLFENGLAEVQYRGLNLYINKQGTLFPLLK